MNFAYGRCDHCDKIREKEDPVAVMMQWKQVSYKPTLCIFCGTKVDVGVRAYRDRPKFLWETYYRHKIWVWIQSILRREVAGLVHRECFDKSDHNIWKIR